MAQKSNHAENLITDRAAEMAHDTVDRVAEVANDTVDRAAEVANGAEHQVRRAAARKAKQAKELQDDVLDAVNDKIGKVNSYVKDNPFTAAGIAFAMGAIVTALLRR
jgi:ElaB/YqjD/DUF883 family membrane-anchored ribosome-binding protein